MRAEPEQWQEVLVRLTPRKYSISCSPLVSPNEVQLTVSVVRYRGAAAAQRGGVGSTFLADRATAAVPVFLQRSPHFRPPADVVDADDHGRPRHRHRAVPRVPAGTARAGPHGPQLAVLRRSAPRRELLLPRRFGGHGRRRPAQPSGPGVLPGPGRRVYVQHKMLDYGADVWRWLEDGAHFYVCGDATRMARDVDAALTEIIRTHGGMSAEAAHDYKRELVADKRYVRDVY